MTELQLFIAGVLAAVIAALLIAGLIGAAIARSKAKGATERAVAAALGRQPPKVDLLIQETPRGHWHYRASQNGHQLIPRRKGGHTSSAYALRAAKRILRVGSVEVHELHGGPDSTIREGEGCKKGEGQVSCRPVRLTSE